MKLGEALTRRSDIQKRIAQMHERLRAAAVVQEDETPPEDAHELLVEAGRLADELEKLITAINVTNSQTTLTDGETLTQALARREVLALRQGVLSAAVSASETGSYRYSRSEIRMVRQLNVAHLREQIDQLAQTRRELDTAIQEHNWITELI